MLSLSAAELAFWEDYRQEHGFPVDRLEAATAQSGAYVGATWGGRARADQLVFSPRKQRWHPEAVKAWFDTLTPERFAPRANV